MLYDDADQLEVRHVISLAHHGVDIYGGGEVIPEGELFVKRNCIRLTSKRVYGEISQESRPFFLFSENCSDKEDFYHALLANQERKPDSADNPPIPLQFEQAHLIKLVQQLHASEENLQTRWFNALLGRIFLSMYKTFDVEDFIRTKITKKISRVQKPAFIDSIVVRNINMGNAAPMITNPKLRELTMDGDLTVEADVKYSGNFRLEIAAVARIDLGSRLKAREVDLLLAGILKKLEGHVMFRIKPPPSNRIWFSFETAPKMDLTIEPVVSTRQITYGIILRAIESRIREVLGETLVFPNWDDVPFHQTLLQRYRGGLWADDVKAAHTTVNPGSPVRKPVPSPLLDAKLARDDDDSDLSMPSTPSMLIDQGKTMSMPFLANSAPSGLHGRSHAAKSSASLDTEAISSALDTVQVAPNNAASGGGDMPRALRSNSFASPKVVSPMLSMDPASSSGGDAASGESKAAAAMKGINVAHSQRQSLTSSLNGSPKESPVGSPDRSAEAAEYMARAMRSKTGSLSSNHSNISAPGFESTVPSAAALAAASAATEGFLDTEQKTQPDQDDRGIPPALPRRQSAASKKSEAHSRNNSAASDTGSVKSSAESESAVSSAKPTKSRLLGANKRQSIGIATAAAKRWGLGIMTARQQVQNSNANAKPSGTASGGNGAEDVEASSPIDSNQLPEIGPTSAPIPPLRTSSVAHKSSASSLGLERRSSYSPTSLSHDAGADVVRRPSPSRIPRRVSTQSLSSNSATTPTSRQPSRIPTPTPRASNPSLRNASISSTASNPVAPSAPGQSTVVLSPTASYSSLSLPKTQRPQSYHPPSPSPQLNQGPLSPGTHARTPSLSNITHGPGSPSHPLGRGQPLPPPGTPLPGPQRPGTWAGAASALGGIVIKGMKEGMKRKPVGGVAGRTGSVGSADEMTESVAEGKAPPLPARKKVGSPEKEMAQESVHEAADGEDEDGEDGWSEWQANADNEPGPEVGEAQESFLEPSSLGLSEQADAELTSHPEKTKNADGTQIKKRPVPKPPLPARRTFGAGEPQSGLPALTTGPPPLPPRSKEVDTADVEGGHSANPTPITAFPVENVAGDNERKSEDGHDVGSHDDAISDTGHIANSHHDLEETENTSNNITESLDHNDVEAGEEEAFGPMEMNIEELSSYASHHDEPQLIQLDAQDDEDVTAWEDQAEHHNKDVSSMKGKGDENDHEEGGLEDIVKAWEQNGMDDDFVTNKTGGGNSAYTSAGVTAEDRNTRA